MRAGTTGLGGARAAVGRRFPGLPPHDPGEPAPDAAARLVREIVRADRGRTVRAGRGAPPDPLDNPRVPAGYTYLAQLVAHDLGFEPELPGASPGASPAPTRSYRTPALDLDCLYGRGPLVEPHLYAHAATGDEGPLARFRFARGRAEQIGDGVNPGEPDLPRVMRSVVRLGSGDLAQLADDREVSLAELLGRRLEGRLGGRLGEWIAPGARSRVTRALAERVTLDERVTVRVEPWQVVTLDVEPRSVRYALPSDGARLVGRKLGERASRWFSVPPLSLATIGRAAIADPRNDQNTIVSQVHLALSYFHDAVLARVAQERRDLSPARCFEEARRLVVWHYQWIVVHDLLDRLVGGELAEEVRASPREPSPFLPLEVSGAALRIGHAMARPTYRLNDFLEPLPLFDGAAEDDLRGERPLRARWSLQWDRFFGPDAQRSRRLDTSVSAALLEVPVQGALRSIPELDLLRGWQLGLPSGGDVARALGLEPLSGAGELPLVLYVLLEAEAGGGEQLGPVAGRLVGEALLDRLRTDPDSWAAVDPDWSPRRAGLFANDELTFLDLVRFAGLPVTREAWNAWLRAS